MFSLMQATDQTTLVSAATDAQNSAEKHKKGAMCVKTIGKVSITACSYYFILQRLRVVLMF